MAAVGGGPQLHICMYDDESTSYVRTEFELVLVCLYCCSVVQLKNHPSFIEELPSYTSLQYRYYVCSSTYIVHHYYHNV